MTIESLFITADAALPMQSPTQITVVAGKGIRGDRNFDKYRWPGQNLTLIEAEQVERFNQRSARNLSYADLRRNIVTRGVDLNALEQHRFAIGSVILQGIELCEPCRALGERLQTENQPPAAVVKAWLARGGLRCDVIQGGIIAVGDTLKRLD